MDTLPDVRREVVGCTRCPRLVEHRETVARAKRRMYADWDYWGRPLPSFGDPDARLLIVGLAPAAHGANRTGRMFTGDRSGDFLFTTLHELGFASSPISRGRDDGMRLDDAYVTAVARCAPPGNRPLREELDNCRRYLVAELSLLRRVRVVMALGRIAFDGVIAAYRDAGVDIPRPRPPFAHGAAYDMGDVTLMASYHPSRQNTQTGRLTQQMLTDAFRSAKEALAWSQHEGALSSRTK